MTEYGEGQERAHRPLGIENVDMPTWDEPGGW